MAVRNYIREGLQPDGLCVVFGMEYDTPDGDFLVFGPFEYFPAGLGARELLQAVADAGGTAVAAHPFRRSRPVSEFVISEGLCGIVETRNGRNTFDENLLAEAWLGRYAVAACSGSDAHTLAELGCVATRFESPVTSRADLIRVLNARRASAQSASAA